MRRELLLFREMIDAAVRIREVVGDLDAGSLHVDELRLESVLWNFSVLGEAAAQMLDEVKQRHPDIGWTQPARLGNRIVSTTTARSRPTTLRPCAAASSVSARRLAARVCCWFMRPVMWFCATCVSQHPVEVHQRVGALVGWGTSPIALLGAEAAVRCRMRPALLILRQRARETAAPRGKQQRRARNDSAARETTAPRGLRFSYPR